MRPKIKEFWGMYETKIITVLGFILVAVISFEAGVINGAKTSQKPVVIEQKTANRVNQEQNGNGSASEAQNLPQEGVGSQNGPNTPPQTMPAGRQDCAFVGSKNSNKLHLSSCRWARNIKPENLVCFSSVDEAAKKGYQPDANCIK